MGEWKSNDGYQTYTIDLSMIMKPVQCLYAGKAARIFLPCNVPLVLSHSFAAEYSDMPL